MRTTWVTRLKLSRLIDDTIRYNLASLEVEKHKGLAHNIQNNTSPTNTIFLFIFSQFLETTYGQLFDIKRREIAVCTSCNHWNMQLRTGYRIKLKKTALVNKRATRHTTVRFDWINTECPSYEELVMNICFWGFLKKMFVYWIYKAVLMFLMMINHLKIIWNLN